MVACANDGCADKVVRLDNEAHLQLCPHRTEKCDHCNVVVKSVEMLNHLRKCPKVVVSCDCGFECTRDALTAHRGKDCLLVEIQRDVIGCAAKMMRGDYEKHQEQAATYHVRLLSTALCSIKQENVTLSSAVQKLEATVAIQKLEAAAAHSCFQIKWRITDIAAKKQKGSGANSPVFDVFFHGNHKLYIRAVNQDNNLGLYLYKDGQMSVDKSRLGIVGSSFTVTKAGLPGKKAVLPNLFLAPPNEGYGWKVLINDMRPYIDNDSINVVLDLKLNKDNETIVL